MAWHAHAKSWYAISKQSIDRMGSSSETTVQPGIILHIFVRFFFILSSENNFGWRLTSLGADSLAASCKVKGLSDCQLRQVLILLLHVDGSPLRQELCEGGAVVHDVAVNLEAAVAQLAS